MDPTLFQALNWKFVHDGLLISGKTLNDNFVFYKIIDFVIVLYLKFNNNCSNNEIIQLRQGILKKGASLTKWVVKSPFENSVVINQVGNVERMKIRVLRIEFSTTKSFYDVKKFLENMPQNNSFQLFNNKIKPIVQFFTEQSGFQPCGWYILKTSSKNIKQKNIMKNGIIVGVNEETRANLYLEPCPEIQSQAPLRVVPMIWKPEEHPKHYQFIKLEWFGKLFFINPVKKMKNVF